MAVGCDTFVRDARMPDLCHLCGHPRGSHRLVGIVRNPPCDGTGQNIADPINHNEAWSVACMKRDEPKANLARCYIELRYLATRLCNGTPLADDRERLHAICHANDL